MGRIAKYLWRSPLFPRKLSFTREGKVVVALSLGLGLAAVNTGNNLLYLVFGLSLSLIIVSGLLSELNIKDVRIEDVRFTKPVANGLVLFPVAVHSNRKRLASFAIEAWPLVEGDIHVEPARYLELRPGEHAIAACQATFRRRGEYKVTGMVISTTFPFSFFRKSVVFPYRYSLIVHPQPRFLPHDDSGLDPGGDESRSVAGRGIEFFGVRDFREGDNPRHIVHRLSVGRSAPIVREFEDEGVRKTWIAIVNVDDGREGGAERVESAIEVAAGIALRRLARGEVVGLVSVTGVVEPGSGGAQADIILDFLATLPVLAMNEPGVDAQIRAFANWPEDAKVVWVRPV